MYPNNKKEINVRPFCSSEDEMQTCFAHFRKRLLGFRGVPEVKVAMGSPQEHFSCGGQRPPDECESERGGVFEWTEEEDPACFAMDLERLRQSDLTLGMDGENPESSACIQMGRESK